MKLTDSVIPFHTYPAKDFLLRFFIDNPRTELNNETLLKEFSELFPEDDIEMLVDELYLAGSISKFSLFQIYVCDSIQNIIEDAIDTQRTPEFCEPLFSKV